MPSPARETPPCAHAHPRHVGATIDEAPLGSLLLQVIRAHARLATEFLARADLTPPHEIVLLYLDEHGPTSQSDLVHYLARDRSTVTATLQAMERQDLVERAPCSADRRTMTVTLTAKGRAIVPRARSAWRQLEAATTASLTDPQLRALAETLTAVRDHLNRTLDALP